MKQEIERRKPEGLANYLSLVISTAGVGYLPLAPGTWGSAVGVLIYVAVGYIEFLAAVTLSYRHGWQDDQIAALFVAANSVLLAALSFIGVWASSRSTELLGSSDPSRVVIDEVIGQLVTFVFIPHIISWPLILAGFLLFRLFDIWKPYPIDHFQDLPGGLGICVDDIAAGVCAGICLAVIYAVSLSI